MFPGGNGNADLGYNKHAHVHGHGHGHGHNQFLAQPPPPPTHFSLPPGGGQGLVTPMVATGIPLTMPGGPGIDWAQLAQQWIHMRDAAPVAMPVAPPPPIIGNVREFHNQALAMPLPSVIRAGHPQLQEHGEADMDMDDENERGHGAESPPPPAPVVTQSQWMAASEAPAPVVDSIGGAAVTLGKQPWNNWQQGKSAGNPTAHIPSLLKLNVSNPNEPQQQLQLQMQAQQHQQPAHPHHPQAPQPHPHHLPPHTQHQQQQQAQQESGSGSASSEIDANKRKMLPAWIREGLEKMEREKLRQLERQQPSNAATDDEVNQVKQVSSKTLTTPVNLLNIANVASDSEDSVDLPGEAHGELKDQQIGNELISKDGGDVSSSDEREEEQQGGPIESGNREAAEHVKAATENDVNGKNYEERLADLMLVVRRTLTEILLETTNEEIAAIAGETLKAHRAKASSAQVIRKSALSSITGNLGLAAYGDSSSESEEDEDDEGERQADAGKDADKSVLLSAEELKARIRRSKRSFERVIDDIEDRVAKQEQLDEQTLQRHRRRELERSGATAVDHRRSPVTHELPGESVSQPSHEKPQQFNGKRPSRKERTTRFSDNKDGKQQSHSYVQQVVAAAAVAPLGSLTTSTGSQKLKPVPNPATNLLQMPESVATMLSAADKALHKANKSSRKSKSKRRHSSTSSSSSSSSGSSSSSDSDDSSSSSSGSKTSSSRGKRVSRHGHGRSHGSSRSKYERRDRDRERERDRDRGRRQDRSHYSGGSSGGSHRQRHRRRSRDSHSGEDTGGRSSYHRSSRKSSSRSHDHGGGGSSSSGRKRHHTRSRSKSRSTHHSSSNAYSSSSSASHPRKRH